MWFAETGEGSKKTRAKTVQRKMKQAASAAVRMDCARWPPT